MWVTVYVCVCVCPRARTSERGNMWERVCVSDHQVSLGAEAIALNKDIYCRHVSKAALEVVEKTFLYNHAFISRRLRERVSRDVHLEEVLRHVFIKSARDSAFGKGRIHEV